MHLIVIGAGASGMMCAGQAALFGADVLLIERNRRCGRKLSITGKGRCNVTNACNRDEFFRNVVHNSRFLYSAWADFSSEDTVCFFESCGVPLKVERGNRVFPVSDQASDVVSALQSFCDRSGVRIQNGTVQSILLSRGSVSGVRLTDGLCFPCDAAVIACGGQSYPSTGSDGSGFRLAEECGHTIVPPKPSLVPWEVEEAEFCRSLQGLSLKNVRVTVSENGKEVFSDFGEMLFAHFGVTGPLILSASAFLLPGMKIRIDLKPALSREQLDKRLLSDFDRYRMKNLSNAFGDLLPQKLIVPFLFSCGLDPYRKTHTLTRAERGGVAEKMKNLVLTAVAPRPFAEAIVTAGGVSVSEVNPKTMESRLVPGLYFCGEVLDVDAFTGGFNLQIAFSTGHLAGTSAALNKVKSEEPT